MDRNLVDLENAIQSCFETGGKYKAENWFQLATVVKKILSHLPENEFEKLQENMELLTSLVRSMEQILDMLKKNNPFESWSTIHIVLDILFGTVDVSFNFCKYADKNYSSKLHELAKPLSNLFKVTYQVLKVSIGLLENLQDTLGNMDNNVTLELVLSQLRKISDVLIGVDVMATVVLWKFMKRLCATHMEDMVASQKMLDIVFEICPTTQALMENGYQALKQNNENLFDKCMKVLRLFSSILMQLMKDFNDCCSVVSCRKIYRLLHVLQCYSECISQKLQQGNDGSGYSKMKEFVFSSVDLLTGQFASMSNSSTVILLHTVDKNMLDKEMNQDFALLILTCRLMQKLSAIPENLSGKWLGDVNDCKENGNILRDVFIYVEKCSENLFLERHIDEMVGIDSGQNLSPYEHVLMDICQFCAKVLPSRFNVIESVLLTNLLSSSTYRAMIASDVWCYLSRCGPSALCLDHLQFLGKMFLSIESKCNEMIVSHVSRLFKRLFWFLEQDYHDGLTQFFPVCKNTLSLWRLIPMSHLHVVNKVQICNEILSVALALMAIEERDEDLDRNIVNGLHSVSNIARCQDLFMNIDQGQRNEIIKQVVEFWSCFDDLQTDIDMNECLMVAMLDLTSALMMCVPETIPKVLRIVKDVLLCTTSISFQMTSANFLINLKHVRFHPSAQKSCLSDIASMFAYLLTSSDWIVECVAMAALKQFAEVTIYSSALSSFLPPAKRKDFTKYLKNQPCETNLRGHELTAYVYVESNNFLHSCSSSKQVEEVKLLLDSLQNDVQKLHQLTVYTKLPLWCNERVDLIVEWLQKCKSSCNTFMP